MKISFKLIFYFFVAEKGLIFIDATVVVDTFERRNNVAHQLQDPFIIERIDFLLEGVAVQAGLGRYFPEFRVQFLENVCKVNGDVIGLNVLEVGDGRVVDIREILNICTGTLKIRYSIHLCS